MPKYPERPQWPVASWNISSGAWSPQEAFPAPDTDPYEPSTRSNLQLFRTVTGQQVGINSSIKFLKSPLRITWTRLSGSWLKEEIERYVESGTGLRLTPHTGPPMSGVFVEIRPRARPGFMDTPPWGNRATLWDIQAEFQPLNVESGS